MMSYCLNPNCNYQTRGDRAFVCQQCQGKLLINNCYRALKPIGQGGFGKTFLAVDESDGISKLCVIKHDLAILGKK